MSLFRNEVRRGRSKGRTRPCAPSPPIHNPIQGKAKWFRAGLSDYTSQAVGMSATEGVTNAARNSDTNASSEMALQTASISVNFISLRSSPRHTQPPNNLNWHARGRLEHPKHECTFVLHARRLSESFGTYAAFRYRRAVPGLPLAKSSWRESAVFGQRDGKVPTIVENPECGR